MISDMELLRGCASFVDGLLRCTYITISRLMNDLRRLLRTAARVSRTRYPGFIFGLPVTRGEIPVFTYHDVETQDFARDLEFLRSNGYRTLSLEEYLAARNGGRRPARAVLLTFDDARKSFWTVALPLLRTFDARAVLFAPTFWMQDDLFMSWQEVRACVESGLVDVQSHAHRHALVATSPQLSTSRTPRRSRASTFTTGRCATCTASRSSAARRRARRSIARCRCCPPNGATWRAASSRMPVASSCNAAAATSSSGSRTGGRGSLTSTADSASACAAGSWTNRRSRRWSLRSSS